MPVRLRYSRWLSVLVAAMSASALYIARAQNASIVPKPPAHSQSASGALRDNRMFYFTVINMSGQSRQALVGKERVDLPVAQEVVLKWRAGDVLHVISDTNSRVDEWVSISRADAAHVVAIR